MSASRRLGAAALALCLLASRPASAEPLVRVADLPAPAQRALVAEIARARRERPAVFEQVRAVRVGAVAQDRKKRGRVAHVAPALRALGPGALLPMLSELLADAPGEPARVTLAVQLGLLQALGELRDARAAPTLTAALDRASDPRVARTAAVALGALGSDAAIDALLARGGAPSAIAGLGAARRARATVALAARLDGADDATAAHLADALGDAANEWAWQTSRVAASGERDAVVGAATAALARAIISREGAARARAGRALRLAGPSAAVPALRAVRGAASGSALDAVDALISSLTERTPR